MSVLSPALAKVHLNITVTTHDTELQTFIDAAEAALSNLVGPLTPTPQTDRVMPANGRLRVRTAPVASLTSVTSAEGQTVALTGLHLDARPGVITTNIVGVGFISPYYDVAYSAGRATVPDDLLMAVKELVRHMWTTQRGTGGRPGSASEPTVTGYLMPYRVQELIAPHLQTGFA